MIECESERVSEGDKTGSGGEREREKKRERDDDGN